jgi:hypothetical protein
VEECAGLRGQVVELKAALAVVEEKVVRVEVGGVATQQSQQQQQQWPPLRQQQKQKQPPRHSPQQQQQQQQPQRAPQQLQQQQPPQQQQQQQKKRVVLVVENICGRVYWQQLEKWCGVAAGRVWWEELQRQGGKARWRVSVPNEEALVAAVKERLSLVGSVRDWLAAAPPFIPGSWGGRK